MRHIPIKLGPLALLLTVISICMTTLGILSFSTAGAEARMSEKYAATVQLRYELESRGQLFLREAAEAAAEGRLSSLEDAETDEDGVVRRSFQEESFLLTVGILPEGGGGFRVVEWKLSREWEPEESLGSLWMGE